MGIDQGIPARAPASFPDGVLRATIVPAGEQRWARIARRGPNYFSTDPGNRYSTPRIPHGVLYLGENSVTCFWEAFWDMLQSRGDELRVDEQQIRKRKVYTATLARDIQVFDVSNAAHVRRTTANVVGCFNGEYSICREWAVLIYESIPSLDGILYPSARVGAGTNLALFGGRVRASDVQFSGAGLPLIEDPAIAELLRDEEIGWL